MASAQKKSQSSVSHFSHPHLLERTTAPSTTTSNTITCSGCKLRVTTTNGEDYYRCSKTKTCNFSLHSVCYNMPFITNHPSHPTHDLLLFLAPPSSSSPFNTCFACKNHATGLTYHCAECSIFFHPLCLLLPLSLSIKHHPHKIKLEFLPPYDFYCDFCNKPSFSGWLYRCSMCEFDIHIACAMDNLEYHNHMENYKIMRLVAEQVGGGISRTPFDNGITGSRDKKFYNSRKNHSMRSDKIMKIVELELQETEKCSVFHETEQSPVFALSNLEEKTPLRDKLVPLSDFPTPPTPSPSHQFSESYFSIDLTKSYSIHDRRSQVPKEGAEFVVPERIAERAEESCDVVKWSSSDSCNLHRNKMNEAFFKGGLASDFGESRHVEVMKNSKESLAKLSHEDQIVTKPESERCSRSCWRKFLTCCH